MWWRKAGDRDSCSFEVEGPINWTAGAKEAKVAVTFVDKDAPELEGAENIKLGSETQTDLASESVQLRFAKSADHRSSARESPRLP